MIWLFNSIVATLCVVGAAVAYIDDEKYCTLIFVLTGALNVVVAYLGFVRWMGWR